MTLLILLACTGENISAATSDDTGFDPSDADGDGYPAEQDCDDDNPDVNPGKAEVCDDIDNDCDDEIDEDATDATSLYADVDEDGWGNVGNVVLSCGTVEGRVTQSGDCDDNDPDVNPDAQEVCDDDYTDEDCDGFADDDDESVDPEGMTSWYVDADGDGYGDPDNLVEVCHAGSGYSDDGTDCDDTDALLTPDNECDAGWTGTYTGDVAYTATAFGITDTCSASGVTVNVVEDSAAPQLSGSFTCTWATLTTTETITMEGTFISDADMTISMSAGDAVLEDWDTTFEEPGSFYGEIAGTTEIFGQAVTYTGVVDFER
jgi:hypothetical protein